MTSTAFTVEVSHGNDGYEVKVSTGSGEYAKTQSGELDTALRMAVPYMACAAESDPTGRLLEHIASGSVLTPDLVGGGEPVNFNAVSRKAGQGAALRGPRRSTQSSSIQGHPRSCQVRRGRGFLREAASL